MKQFWCFLCNMWVDVGRYREHSFHHSNNPEGIDLPETYNQFKQRFEMVGMFEEREVSEEIT